MLAILMYTVWYASLQKVNTFTTYMSPMVPAKLTIVLSVFSYITKYI